MCTDLLVIQKHRRTKETKERDKGENGNLRREVRGGQTLSRPRCCWRSGSTAGCTWGWKVYVVSADDRAAACSAEFRPEQRAVCTLVKRFDTESFSDFSAKLSNFRGLVLGCMDSYDSNQILILQGFSRSTRFAILCTAQISKFQ
mgnify:CR=1 FL=1